VRHAGGEGPIVKWLESIETVLIVVALVSLWPLLFRFNAAWYWVWLTAVLAAMVWVTVRRLRRIREAAEEAKRKRDEMAKSGRPPFLG
jgi:fatty acid desaturase